MVALAALALRRRDVRAAGEPFKSPGGPLIHLLAFGGIVWMLSAIVTRQDVVGIAILFVVTVAAYVLLRR